MTFSILYIMTRIKKRTMFALFGAETSSANLEILILDLYDFPDISTNEKTSNPTVSCCH